VNINQDITTLKTQQRIGITSTNYASRRLILNKIEGAKYIDVRFFNLFFWKNINLWFLRYFKILRLSPEDIFIRLFLKFKLLFPGFFRLSLLHLFNTINFSKRVPWVISIETCIPFNREIVNAIQQKNPDFSFLRKDESVRSVMEYLVSDSCKGLLALSDCSRNIQTEILNIFPEYGERIKRKLITLHPPQALLINDLEDKCLSYELDSKIRFIFVGRDFFRKGGKQMLEAFDKFKSRKDFELTIISDLESGEENFSFFTESDRSECLKYILDNSSWIKYHSAKPNNEVLQLMKDSHVALLPTWMDTYGYSVLECQASGCPVITTDLRALKEVNNDDAGWLIKVPTNALNHPMYSDMADFNVFGETLRDGLVHALGSIFDDKNTIVTKAGNSMKRIRTKHSTADYSTVLGTIYNGAFAQN
jgi:glycosyltransferase involved in cell wall biosynthesis